MNYVFHLPTIFNQLVNADFMLSTHPFQNKQTIFLLTPITSCKALHKYGKTCLEKINNHIGIHLVGLAAWMTKIA